MKVKMIASGSKGNCALVITNDTKFIIDIGVSYLSLKRSLEGNSLSFEEFKGILITHSHTDHIKGLPALIKHTKLLVYIPMDMYHELKNFVPKERCMFIEDINEIDDVTIELIHTSHDTDCSVGYIIKHNQKKVIYVTDTGYINRKFLKQMEDADIYIIESNHDEQMLMDGPYPYFLKQRVISERGHLSNNTTSRYLKNLVTEKTKYVVLAHISEKNNTEEIAYKQTKEQLADKNIKILIAKQDEEGPLLEV